ncbi:hypothetical protein [Marinobacter alexandrii]|uniref:hypothetical protein n=1 Tax=Marinobacter alexandrii TaxID=2570351 RepID=UPI001486B857|nr:hypothetical protein [Marinobacter alexandrii]
MGYERLKKLIDRALNSCSQIAEHKQWSWSQKVTVEVVEGVPRYFVGHVEVTASAAAHELDNTPEPVRSVA